MDESVTERVLRAVEQVPPGRLVSYGDVAALVGIGARQVGRIMSRGGHGVPWWRVTNRAGELPAPVLAEARRLWEAEGIALRPDARGAVMSRHRADLAALASDYERATADLESTCTDPTPSSRRKQQ